MKTFIIPDIHGHYKTLKGLLKEAGVLDHQKNRVDGWQVISIGDLANCVRTDKQKDVQCLKRVGDWIDTLILGNHEYPYFGGFGAFGGFVRYPEVEQELNRIDREGLLAPAALVDDILVTHAGYVPTHGIESAEDGFLYANQCWERDRNHPLFSQVGFSRGGSAATGGILWSGWEETKADEFNQIVGHTPQSNKCPNRRDYDTGKYTICIDCGAKHGKGATGVIVDEDGELTEVSTPFMSGNHAIF